METALLEATKNLKIIQEKFRQCEQSKNELERETNEIIKKI